MRALIDGDILRYEVGYAAESLAKREGRPLPSWELVEGIYEERIARILEETEASEYVTYLTAPGPLWRDQIAITNDYKGTRKDKKPWHFANLTEYVMAVHHGILVGDGYEADDQMAIDHNEGTIICSRDKDFRQLPGWSYSWELGFQPRFGPTNISHEGWLELSRNRKSLRGGGMAFFYGQVLTGDSADNIPGCPGVGPVAAYKALSSGDQLETVKRAYGDDTKLLEQGRLLWLTRRKNEDGTPVLWEIGMTE